MISTQKEIIIVNHNFIFKVKFGGGGGGEGGREGLLGFQPPPNGQKHSIDY